MRTLFAALLLTLPLLACQAQSDGEPVEPATSETAKSVPPVAEPSSPSNSLRDATPTPQGAQASDDCGAGEVDQRWSNSLPTTDVKAAIAEAVGDRPIRYYTQGDPITMDFNPERLNVELGADGRIKAFRCG